MNWQDDTNFELHILTKVEDDEKDYTLHFGSMVLFIPKVGVVPKIGDEVRLYDDGFGWPLRGVVVNNQVVYYRTPLEQKEYQRLQSELRRLEKQIKFFEKKALMDADYEALPEVFKWRLDRFRRNNPDFRWENEPYEVFCCQEAIKIMEDFSTAEEIEAFHRAEYEQQKSLLPSLDYDNHSGNTFSCSVGLAYLFRTEPELVIKAHGALCPLVGCKEYGCVPREEADA